MLQWEWEDTATRVPFHTVDDHSTVPTANMEGTHTIVVTEHTEIPTATLTECRHTLITVVVAEHTQNTIDNMILIHSSTDRLK